MKTKVLTLFVLLATVLVYSSAFAQSYDYENMEEEQYNAFLSEWQGRLDGANQGIATEDATIDSLKKQLDATQADIDANWNEIFAATGLTKADYDKYVADLNALKNDARGILSMSPEEIYRRTKEIDEKQAKLDEMKKSPFAVMTENEKTINEIDSLLAQAREKGKPAVPPTYSVVRGDCLWRIASKKDIYNDAYAWMRIYTSNRDQIKDANLIYPNQVFSIPREVGPNEHLVAKGEFLSKIAGYSNVYGSPFKWNRLYENNKDTISDPNMIYPYQLLKIAR